MLMSNRETFDGVLNCVFSVIGAMATVLKIKNDPTVDDGVDA
jgi:hypothetical protein